MDRFSDLKTNFNLALQLDWLPLWPLLPIFCLCASAQAIPTVWDAFPHTLQDRPLTSSETGSSSQSAHSTWQKAYTERLSGRQTSRDWESKDQETPAKEQIPEAGPGERRELICKGVGVGVEPKTEWKERFLPRDPSELCHPPTSGQPQIHSDSMPVSLLPVSLEQGNGFRLPGRAQSLLDPQSFV